MIGFICSIRHFIQKLDKSVFPARTKLTVIHQQRFELFDPPKFTHSEMSNAHISADIVPPQQCKVYRYVPMKKKWECRKFHANCQCALIEVMSDTFQLMFDSLLCEIDMGINHRRHSLHIRTQYSRPRPLSVPLLHSCASIHFSFQSPTLTEASNSIFIYMYKTFRTGWPLCFRHEPAHVFRMTYAWCTAHAQLM